MAESKGYGRKAGWRRVDGTSLSFFYFIECLFRNVAAVSLPLLLKFGIPRFLLEAAPFFDCPNCQCTLGPFQTEPTFRHGHVQSHTSGRCLDWPKDYAFIGRGELNHVLT